MRASVRSTCSAASSCVARPRSTSLAAWPCVTVRAFSRPLSTNRRSTSLSTTGTPAAAMTWAISPPMTPAPTTAALNTNIARGIPSGVLAPSLAGKHLGPDGLDRGGDPVEPRAQLADQPRVLGAPGVRDRVEAPRPPLGVLPPALDQ